jgi:prepilin-type N-terminal cleavage/methylation domain-containing protein
VKRAFTLIEISIVLIVVGLLIGGILVGQELIRAATVRSQISQIDKFNLATKTFLLKYKFLPGDITSAAANTFGFTSRVGTRGLGDGDGKIIPGASLVYGSFVDIGGETTLFWSDLFTARLIEDSITPYANMIGDSLPGESFSSYFPKSKLDFNSRVLINYADKGSSSLRGDWHVLSIVSLNSTDLDAHLLVDSNITPINAYSIDSKIDDGLPVTGKVLASNPVAANMLSYTSGPTTCFLSAAGNDVYNLSTSVATNRLCSLHFIIK